MSITKNEIKNIKSLLTKKGRKEQKRFTAEGVRLLEEAIRHHFLPEQVYYVPSSISVRGEALLRKMAKRKVSLNKISTKDLKSIADTRTPQGIIGVFAAVENKPTQLYQANNRRLLWCENISDPGNLGTLIRSAQAFAFDLVVISGRCAEAFAPKVVRSSAGAIFGLPVVRIATDEVINIARNKNFKIIATDLKGKKINSLLIKKIKSNKLILAIGAEAEGLSPEIIEKADFIVRIEHSNMVESLNAAVAGSIIMNRIFGL